MIHVASQGTFVKTRPCRSVTVLSSDRQGPQPHIFARSSPLRNFRSQIYQFLEWVCYRDLNVSVF